MSWTEHAEVAAVERRHPGGVEALGGGDHRGVDGAQRQVVVLGNQLSDAAGSLAGLQLDRL